MTPVQAGAIPLFMKNKDVVVEVGIYASKWFIIEKKGIDIDFFLLGSYWVRENACICDSYYGKAFTTRRSIKKESNWCSCYYSYPVKIKLFTLKIFFFWKDGKYSN